MRFIGLFNDWAASIHDIWGECWTEETLDFTARGEPVGEGFPRMHFRITPGRQHFWSKQYVMDSRAEGGRDKLQFSAETK